MDASIQPASSSADARCLGSAWSPAASIAVSRRCAPRLSPSTTHAHPYPVAMLERSRWVVLDGPCEGGVDVGALIAHEGQVLGLSRAAHALGRSAATRPRTTARGRRGRRLGLPSVSHRVEGERADAVEQPVSRARRRLIDDHERAGGQPAEHIDRGRGRHTECGEHELGRRQCARHRRTSPAPTARAGRPGTTGRSSTRSSTAGPGGAPGGDSSDRSAPRSDRRDAA